MNLINYLYLCTGYYLFFIWLCTLLTNPKPFLIFAYDIITHFELVVSYLGSLRWKEEGLLALPTKARIMYLHSL
jgi:hypothetical protein